MSSGPFNHIRLYSSTPRDAGALGLAYDLGTESDTYLWWELQLLAEWPRAAWTFAVTRRRALLLAELRRRSGEAA